MEILSFNTLALSTTEVLCSHALYLVATVYKCAMDLDVVLSVVEIFHVTSEWTLS